ncbi:DciA family protein [Advenella mimigardefordensis]|uniref:DciA family protein n=1 Tax=Advenella mimigardefordensis TaxID=302406 RepID=UPI0004BA6E59|nr:DciA family protein [Advenella mimigardefordensis]
MEHDARRGRLLETAEQFNLIQGLIAQALQLPVGHACRVVGLDNGTLIIAVPSAAHAAKIRQLTTTIHQLLVAKGQRVDQIRIKIQAGLRSSVSTTAAAAPNTRHALGEQARGALLELQQSTDNQQLAETLARILEKNQARRQS